MRFNDEILNKNNNKEATDDIRPIEDDGKSQKAQEGNQTSGGSSRRDGTGEAMEKDQGPTKAVLMSTGTNRSADPENHIIVHITRGVSEPKFTKQGGKSDTPDPLQGQEWYRPIPEPTPFPPSIKPEPTSTPYCPRPPPSLVTVQDKPQIDLQRVPAMPLAGTTLLNLVPVKAVNGEMVYHLPPGSVLTVLTVTPPPNPSKKRRCSQEEKDSTGPYIKKPLNAFMLFMKEQRPRVVQQLKITDNALVNAELGQRWRSLLQMEKDKYTAEAERLRNLHELQHPQWSNRDNYGKKRKRVRRRLPVQA